MTLMDLKTDEFERVVSGSKPTFRTPNRYVFPYHSDSKPTKVTLKRTSSYFSDDDLSSKDVSAAASPRGARATSPTSRNANYRSRD